MKGFDFTDCVIRKKVYGFSERIQQIKPEAEGESGLIQEHLSGCQ